MSHKVELNSNPMTVIVILASFLVALISNQALAAEARAAEFVASSTSTAVPTPVLEDSLNSATSDSADDDTICYRCYAQVEMAQSLIGVHMDLVKKQNNLIRQKSKAVPLPQPMHKSTRKPKISHNSNSNINHTATLSPTIRNRTLEHSEHNKPIVVSRLRVARSTANRIKEGTGAGRNESKKNIDPVLKQLKHKQQQQFNETCKSLYEVQQCLNEISRECLGNLQFHSLEVFSTQWLARLNCPPSHNQDFIPFGALTRSIPTFEEREKVPVPRPISSQEETQKKLDLIFGGRGTSSLGVMLKPTLTRSATQKFNLMGPASQQQLEGTSAVEVFSSSSTKARHLSAANDIVDYNLRQSEYQLLPLGGQLFLIPCFLIILIALITLTNGYLKKSAKI